MEELWKNAFLVFHFMFFFTGVSSMLNLPEEGYSKVKEFLDRIPQEKLAQVSVSCKAYTRALMHFELHLHPNTSLSKEQLDFMQVFNYNICFKISLVQLLCQPSVNQFRTSPSYLVLHSLVDLKLDKKFIKQFCQTFFIIYLVFWVCCQFRLNL